MSCRRERSEYSDERQSRLDQTPVTGGHRYFLKLFQRQVNEMAKLISLPVPASQDAEDHARADTQRNQRLFDWADAVLKRLRLDKAVAAARSIEELRRVT